MSRTGSLAKSSLIADGHPHSSPAFSQGARASLHPDVIGDDIGIEDVVNLLLSNRRQVRERTRGRSREAGSFCETASPFWILSRTE